MGELDGVWRVERIGGLLPPLVGVRKRIRGDRGETSIGPLPGIPFRLEGLTLRYCAPLAGLVDLLDPSSEGYRGTATFHGRVYGHFVMRRANP